jgi:adenine-specific DNA methylase
MAEWAIRNASDVVLEPAAGDGAFVSAAARRLRELGERPGRVIGIEREPLEASKIRNLVPTADIRTADFFDVDPGDVPEADVVIGNPPYIRFHGFAGKVRNKALERVRAQNVALTGLASSWAHFVVHSVAFLKADGRLALVLPAELLHADYAAPVRELLLRRFRSVTVIAFDRMVFHDAQVDAVVLLASRDGAEGFRIVRLPDDRALQTSTIPQSRSAYPHSDRWSADVDPFARDTYSAALEGQETRRIGEFASVDIGFVSGANDYFILDRHKANLLGLPPKVLVPVVTRPRDVGGLHVLETDERRLLDLSRATRLDPPTRRYLRSGIEQGINLRYKCRHRTPWYVVPIPKNRPDGLLPYMSHRAPRLIANRIGTRNSNLLHGVTLRPSAPSIRALAVAMCGSLTLLSAEIEGRAYGGGVLKLETKEAERLVVPEIHGPVEERLEAAFADSDILIREGRIQEAAMAADAIVGTDHARTWAAYEALRDRRLGRKRGGARKR